MKLNNNGSIEEEQRWPRSSIVEEDSHEYRHVGGFFCWITRCLTAREKYKEAKPLPNRKRRDYWFYSGALYCSSNWGE